MYYCCYVVQVCLPALRRAKREWLVWAVNHPGPRLLTVSDDDDDDDDWMMMMRLRMMKIDVFDSDAAESVAIHLLFAFLILVILT